MGGGRWKGDTRTPWWERALLSTVSTKAGQLREEGPLGPGPSLKGVGVGLGICRPVVRCARCLWSGGGASTHTPCELGAWSGEREGRAPPSAWHRSQLLR